MDWVLFDYAGVLSEHQTDEALQAMAALTGRRVPDFHAAYWEHRDAFDVAAVEPDDYWRRVGDSLGVPLDPATIAELGRVDTDSWLTLDRATLTVVGELAAAGTPLALLSNAPAPLARAIEAADWHSDFTHLFFSCDLRAAKPAADVFLRVAEALGAQPREIVFVDDRPENTDAAADLGFRTIDFRDAAGLRAGLSSYGIR